MTGLHFVAFTRLFLRCTVLTLGASLARQSRVCKHNIGRKGGSSERDGTLNLGTRLTRRRSTSVTIGVTAVLVATLSGCSAAQGNEEEDYDYGAVCADQQTELRVEDDTCAEGGAYGWYYIPTGSRAQAVGERVSGGSFNEPPSNEDTYLGGVPSEGGVVERGGFGGESESVGG